MKSNTKRIIRFAIQLFSIGVLLLIDYLLKQLAVDKLAGKDTYVLIKGFLGFVYTENTGAAFSMFSSSTAVLSAVTGIALAGGIVFLYAYKNKPLVYDICIPLIIAGGLGNLIDRLTRGFVVDYIRTLFMNFAIFNFADCLITCGAAAIIVYLIYEIIRDASSKKNIPGGEENE